MDYNQWNNYTAIGYLKFALQDYNKMAKQENSDCRTLTDTEISRIIELLNHAFDTRTTQEAYKSQIGSWRTSSFIVTKISDPSYKLIVKAQDHQAAKLYACKTDEVSSTHPALGIRNYRARKVGNSKAVAKSPNPVNRGWHND